jgi:predicted nucleic acid-binding protein
MSVVFIDTSAFLAILDADDDFHAEAKKTWGELLLSGSPLATSNYILVETCALVQHRLGLKAIRVFQEDIVPLLSIRWVDSGIHSAASNALLAANRKKLSLVDCSSFEVMRHGAIKRAFTFDNHSREQGFDCIPKIKD